MTSSDVKCTYKYKIAVTTYATGRNVIIESCTLPEVYTMCILVTIYLTSHLNEILQNYDLIKIKICVKSDNNDKNIKIS